MSPIRVLLLLFLISTCPAFTGAGPLPVKVGLERLSEAETGDLAHQRIGLIVHAASITIDGQHAIDVLRDHGFKIVRLFTPEHGLRSRAAAGEAVTSGHDAASGLPVISLYGEQRRPRPEDLTDLDVLIFDLQGAGVRFYTYASTLILCLDAAAEAGIDFVVLDRPNPLGGERVEGPLAASRQEVPESFVNLAPGPLVHGLTLGEMARLVNAGRARPARLRVVPMSGWQRSMTWRDTGRPWPLPSPNLLSAEAALAYPGIALLEATNISEGRGTDAPFLFVGAPWLKSPAPSQKHLAEKPLTPLASTGFRLIPTPFIPHSSPAAPKPKYLDEECSGWRIEVVDTALAEPYRLGLELLDILRRQPGFQWRRDGAALTWLLGTPRVYADLMAGKSVDEIVANDAQDHAAWRLTRRGALLY